MSRMWSSENAPVRIVSSRSESRANLKARTDIAVTARNILPDVGSEDSKMKMKGDRAAERPKDDSEKSLPCARQVRSFFD
jgi:hypothetical protein